MKSHRFRSLGLGFLCSYHLLHPLLALASSKIILLSILDQFRSLPPPSLPLSRHQSRRPQIYIHRLLTSLLLLQYAIQSSPPTHTRHTTSYSRVQIYSKTLSFYSYHIAYSEHVTPRMGHLLRKKPFFSAKSRNGCFFFLFDYLLALLIWQVILLLLWRAFLAVYFMHPQPAAPVTTRSDMLLIKSRKIVNTEYHLTVILRGSPSGSVTIPQGR